MIKLGVNSVLFGGYDFATAARHIALAGYDGIEISAITGMCEHLELKRWKEQASDLKAIVAENGLEWLSMEFSKLEGREEDLMRAFEAAAEIGIPVINVGPGGESGNEDSLKRSIDLLSRLSKKAETFGVTLCVKAHVGQAIFDTPTTLRAMQAIDSPAFGIDMDPSHIHRAGEDPDAALAKVISRVKHVHIRDCKGRQSGPGAPPDQACGRGDIDLMGYCRAMVDNGYSGPVSLEVIGALKIALTDVCIIAAESYGYLNACLKHLGGR